MKFKGLLLVIFSGAYALTGASCQNESVEQIRFCIDEDDDGFGQNCEAGPDCDDADPRLFRTVTLCVDGDLDQFGSQECFQQCIGELAPKGFAENDDDCVDDNPLINPGIGEHCRDGIDNNCNEVIDEQEAICLSDCADNDFDGFQSARCGGSDCDDGDADKFREVLGFMDNDGDGFGKGDIRSFCVGYYLSKFMAFERGDCDDQDSRLFDLMKAYRDSDTDGYGTGELVSVCSGEMLKQGYTEQSGDCDDHASDIRPGIPEHCLDSIDNNCDGLIDIQDEQCAANCADEDGDGYKDLLCGGADCDDEDASKYVYLDAYTDSDMDGYGIGGVVQVCSGLSLQGEWAYNNKDCDDQAANRFRIIDAFSDMDYDGYGAGLAEMVCVGHEMPAGYSANGNDCNDMDSSAYRMLQLYEDEDSDGAGTGMATTACVGKNLPEGYAGNYLDCNDSDETQFVAYMVYADQDHDHYGDGGASEYCGGYLIPEDYALRASDCDDADPNRNPGMLELCGDGVDNDCDGTADNADCSPVGLHWTVDRSDPTNDDSWSGATTTDVHMVDFDNDGDLDIIWANQVNEQYQPQKIHVLQNDGSGGFSAVATDNLRLDSWTYLAPADVNNDGLTDFFALAPTMSSQNFTLFLNTSPDADDIQFVEQPQAVPFMSGTTTGNAWAPPIAVDVDQNGWIDAVIPIFGLYPDDSPQPSIVLLNSGRFDDLEEVFQLESAWQIPARLGKIERPLGVAHGDLNKDGWPDLFMGFAGRSVRLLLNEGAQRDGFTDVTHWLDSALNEQLPETRAVRVQFNDLDLDADLDIIMVNDASCMYPYEEDCDLVMPHPSVIFENTGLQSDGSYSFSLEYLPALNTMHDARGLQIADVDNDGRPDVVIANAYQGIGHDGGIVEVLLNQGNLTFLPYPMMPTVDAGAFGLALGDVNGDSVLDFALAINEADEFGDFSNVLLLSD